MTEMETTEVLEDAEVIEEDEVENIIRKITPEEETELFVRRREIRESKSTFEEQNNYAKSLKKKWESLQDDCDKWLDGIDAANNVSLNGFPADTPLAEIDETWQDVKLADLVDPAIKPAAIKALEDNNPPITTLGELTDWQALKADFWIKDIPNVGAAAAENIADATTGFWERRDAEKNSEEFIEEEQEDRFQE